MRCALLELVRVDAALDELAASLDVPRLGQHKAWLAEVATTLLQHPRDLYLSYRKRISNPMADLRSQTAAPRHRGPPSAFKGDWRRPMASHCLSWRCLRTGPRCTGRAAPRHAKPAPPSAAQRRPRPLSGRQPPPHATEGLGAPSKATSGLPWPPTASHAAASARGLAARAM